MALQVKVVKDIAPTFIGIPSSRSQVIGAAYPANITGKVRLYLPTDNRLTIIMCITVFFLCFIENYSRDVHLWLTSLLWRPSTAPLQRRSRTVL